MIGGPAGHAEVTTVATTVAIIIRISNIFVKDNSDQNQSMGMTKVKMVKSSNDFLLGW